MKALWNPLVGPPPVEVPLASAPLVRVVAQVRFPVIASVERREYIGPFQERIRAAYPVLRGETSRGVVVGPDGMREAPSATIWRFHDLKSEWKVSLAPDFVALETVRYRSRDDFMARLRVVLEALVEHFDPKVMDRLGLRYIDRVTGEQNLADLCQLVRPEVCGILSTPLSDTVRHAVSEQLFVLPEDRGLLSARWGLLPARATVDPAAIEPIEEPSWLLDVDAFQTFEGGSHPLTVETTLERARGFAERIYSVFRWAVTDEFLRRYGGQP